VRQRRNSGWGALGLRESLGATGCCQTDVQVAHGPCHAPSLHSVWLPCCRSMYLGTEIQPWNPRVCLSAPSTCLTASSLLRGGVPLQSLPLRHTSRGYHRRLYCKSPPHSKLNNPKRQPPMSLGACSRSLSPDIECCLSTLRVGHPRS
jgi:hypothetical protein